MINSLCMPPLFCYVLTINHLSNHSYLVYTIDVSVILSEARRA